MRAWLRRSRLCSARAGPLVLAASDAAAPPPVALAWLRAGPSARPRTGQQLVEPPLRVILHARDDVGEIGKRVNPARLACRDECVQAGDAHAGVDVADEEVVLAAERDSAEGA